MCLPISKQPAKLSPARWPRNSATVLHQDFCAVCTTIHSAQLNKIQDSFDRCTISLFFWGGLCKYINCGFYIFLSLKVLPQASGNQSLKVSSLLRPERSLRPLCWRFVGADAQLECSKAMRRDGWDGLHHVAPWIEIPRPLQIVWDGRNN